MKMLQKALHLCDCIHTSLKTFFEGFALVTIVTLSKKKFARNTSLCDCSRTCVKFLIFYTLKCNCLLSFPENAFKMLIELLKVVTLF